MILAPLFLALVLNADDSLAQAFIAAINSKDRAVIKTFISERFDPKISPEEFSGRLMGIVNQGAPLKLEKTVDDKPTLYRALISDKNGERLALTLNLDGKTPPKITGVLLGDPESLTVAPPKDFTGWKTVASLAKDLREATESPAVALAYAIKDQPIQESVSGIRELRKADPATTQDVWHLGSISKSVTSTLIGRLIEKGKLTWGTKLADVLSDVELTAEQKQITILQIMRHRSGLPQDMGFNRAQVMKIVGDEKDGVKVRERYMRDILSRQMKGKPGAQFAYSNAGYAILGHIAERLMNKPFEQLCRELVFEPMGLNSAVAGSANLPARRPRGHWKENDKLVPVTIDGPLQQMMMPAGDMSMTICDLVRYGQAHMAGLAGKDGVLKSATIKKLHEALDEEPGGPGYACGWSVGPLRGTQMRHGHNGSNGTFRAELAFFPESGLVVASVVNMGGESDPSPPLQAVLAVARRFAPA